LMWREDDMRIKTVRPLGRYRLELEFSDGTSGQVDLGHLAGSGVFAAWEAPGAFEDVSVGSGGEASWNCGVDLCADALYLRLTGKRAEDLFAAQGTEHRVA